MYNPPEQRNEYLLPLPPEADLTEVFEHIQALTRFIVYYVRQAGLNGRSLDNVTNAAGVSSEFRDIVRDKLMRLVDDGELLESGDAFFNV